MVSRTFCTRRLKGATDTLSQTLRPSPLELSHTHARTLTQVYTTRSLHTEQQQKVQQNLIPVSWSKNNTRILEITKNVSSFRRRSERPSSAAGFQQTTPSSCCGSRQVLTSLLRKDYRNLFNGVGDASTEKCRGPPPQLAHASSIRNLRR